MEMEIKKNEAAKKKKIKEEEEQKREESAFDRQLYTTLGVHVLKNSDDEFKSEEWLKVLN